MILQPVLVVLTFRSPCAHSIGCSTQQSHASTVLVRNDPRRVLLAIAERTWQDWHRGVKRHAGLHAGIATATSALDDVFALVRACFIFFQSCGFI